MFGLGMGEVLIILVLALVLLGPDKLPDAAKQLGRGLRELRKASDDIKQQFESEMKALETHVSPSQRPAAELGRTENSRDPGAVVPLATAENVPGLDAVRLEPTAAAASNADIVTRES